MIYDEFSMGREEGNPATELVSALVWTLITSYLDVCSGTQVVSLQSVLRPECPF